MDKRNRKSVKKRKIGHLSNGFIKKNAEPHTKNGRGDRAKMVKNDYYSSFTEGGIIKYVNPLPTAADHFF